jgi:hypothetical protein
MGERLIQAAVGYLFFGGIASLAALAALLTLTFLSSVALGARRAVSLAKQVSVFALVLFAWGLPANVGFTLVMRGRFYADHDPLVDWLPWFPSGSWIIDWSCGGQYLGGGTAWMIAAAWVVFALPVWALALWTTRTILTTSPQP